mmetsp:Transcript_9087/g.27669  ORF Transcript_9087/g.27669 Transcript_9087/m.27669 type:complete len:227 (+) Transcript_9087:380-1060(+)
MAKRRRRRGRKARLTLSTGTSSRIRRCRTSVRGRAPTGHATMAPSTTPPPTATASSTTKSHGPSPASHSTARAWRACHLRASPRTARALGPRRCRTKRRARRPPRPPRAARLTAARRTGARFRCARCRRRPRPSHARPTSSRAAPSSASRCINRPSPTWATRRVHQRSRRRGGSCSHRALLMTGRCTGPRLCQRRRRCLSSSAPRIRGRSTVAAFRGPRRRGTSFR